MSETWGGYDRNVYYNPEKCGLRLIGVLEDDEPWEFNMVIVVQDTETGKVYAGHDLGCSCPTPFEDTHGFGDLTEIRSVEDIHEFVKAHDPSSSYSAAWPLGDRRKLYGQVRDALCG